MQIDPIVPTEIVLISLIVPRTGVSIKKLYREPDYGITIDRRGTFVLQLFRPHLVANPPTRSMKPHQICQTTIEGYG